MSEEKATCETCEHWALANAEPQSHWNDGGDMITPRADLRFATCNYASFQEDRSTPDPWPKAVVFDGSGYFAELSTRNDHFCGAYEMRIEQALKEEDQCSGLG